MERYVFIGEVGYRDEAESISYLMESVGMYASVGERGTVWHEFYDADEAIIDGDAYPVNERWERRCVAYVF